MVQRRGSRKTRFQKGNVPHNKGTERILDSHVEEKEYVRLERNVQRMADHKSPSTMARKPAENQKPQVVMRPKPAEPTMLETAQTSQSEEPEDDGYRVLHTGKTADLFNEAFKGHQEFRPECKGKVKWYYPGEIQRGICSRNMVHCSECGYRSARRKLYKDAETPPGKRGPKTAAPNLGLQVASMHTGSSGTAINRLLLGANIPAPSRSSMQATANKVGEKIIEENEKDMKKRRDNLKTVQKARGNDSSIDISMDTRYNNPIHSGVGKTPFQPSTQSTQLASEHESGEGQIIYVNNQSKLCQICVLARNKGETPRPHKCTATLEQHDSIGDEKRSAKQTLEGLNNDGLPANIIVTDGDGKAFSAAEELYLEGKTDVPPTGHKDPRHVSNTQRKHIIDCDFSKQMFGVKTEKQRKYLQNRLASDISARCQAEHKKALQHFGGDVGRVSSHMAKTRGTLSKCYRGDHSLCRKNSFACRAKANDNWLSNSCYLTTGFKLHSPTEKDLQTLNGQIEFRLGQNMLDSTKYLLTTQKCEAGMKSINSKAPRNITFSRNYSARVHAAVRGMNSGTSEAIVAECAAVGAPLTPGSRVTRQLLKMQENERKAKESKKTDKAKSARIKKKGQLFKLHENKPEKKTNLYIKNDSMPKTDHAYCKVRKNT